MPMILEGIVTTANAGGTPHAAPMGPETDEEISYLVLKPFQDSTTFRNLRRTGSGIFHVTDDVELLAQAAVGHLRLQVHRQPATPQDAATSQSSAWYVQPAPEQTGYLLENCCRWFRFHVVAVDDSQPRARLECAIDARGSRREFFGFNRAKHAVVEAAILATRAHLIPAEELQREFERLRILVEKTGGGSEKRAFEFLEWHLRQAETNVAAEASSNPLCEPRDPAFPSSASGTE